MLRTRFSRRNDSPTIGDAEPSRIVRWASPRRAARKAAGGAARPSTVQYGRRNDLAVKAMRQPERRVSSWILAGPHQF